MERWISPDSGSWPADSSFPSAAQADLCSMFGSFPQMHDLIILHPQIPADPKALAAQAMAECDKALCEGGDEELQLFDCCLKVKKAMTCA